MSEDTVSIRTKKRFICDNVNKLTIDDKKEIRVLLVRAGKNKNIIYNKDGAAVNLDILGDNIITSIYALIDHKIKRLNSGV